MVCSVRPSDQEAAGRIWCRLVVPCEPIDSLVALRSQHPLAVAMGVTAHDRERAGGWQSDVALVDIAPPPRLARLSGDHDRMVGLLVVPHAMAVGGVVRAADLATCQAHQQVHPAVAASQTQGASARPRLHAAQGFVMRARAHVPSPSPPPATTLARQALSENPTRGPLGTGRPTSAVERTAARKVRQAATRSRPIPSHDRRRERLHTEVPDDCRADLYPYEPALQPAAQPARYISCRDPRASGPPALRRSPGRPGGRSRRTPSQGVAPDPRATPPPPSNP
jgi:hypothetical protein